MPRYENVDEGYLDQRRLKSGAAGWVLLAGLGVAYVISGDFAGWNFGLARGRLGRPADRHDPHGPHVHVHGLRPGGDVLGDADLRRRLHVRAPGDGPVGRLSHRHRDPHRVRDRAGGDRRVHRRLRRVAGHPRDHDGLAAVSLLLRRLHRRAPHRRRRGAEGHVRDHGAGRRRADRLRRRDDPRVQRVEPDRHQAGHEQVRRQRLPAVRLRRRAQRVRLRHLVLPRRRGRAARRRGGARPEEGHAQGDHRRDADPARVRRADPHAGAGRRRLGDDHGLRQPAAAGRRHRPRRGLVHRRVRQLRRPRRPRRELLLDHLRLLAPAVRALARGLLPARAVGDERPPRAAHRADPAGRHRLPARRDHRGRRAHDPDRRVRRDGLLRAHAAQPHHPAPQRARPGAALHDARRHADLGRSGSCWRSPP